MSTLNRNTIASTFFSNPFIAGPMITEMHLFVGRREELQEITNLMSGAQPISVNVVGERRIGKSSLLYRLLLVWEQYVQRKEAYIVIYLSLQNAHFQNKENFYQGVIRALVQKAKDQHRNDLATILKVRSYNHASFTHVLEQLAQAKVLPVICLDEFEALLRYKDEFDNSFYDHLRSLMNRNVMMLVVASYKGLDTYSTTYALTSSFFNLGHVLHLGELTDEEVVDLVRLPASTVSGSNAALSMEEQRQARRWAGRHPYRLQLAGSFLCQARSMGKNFSWAKRRYDNEVGRLDQSDSMNSSLRWWLPVRWLVWNLPRRLGHLSRFIGRNVDDVKTWLAGIFIIVLIVLIILGILERSQIFHWIANL